MQNTGTNIMMLHTAMPAPVDAGLNPENKS
jgi:hypothetical protein